MSDKFRLFISADAKTKKEINKELDRLLGIKSSGGKKRRDNYAEEIISDVTDVVKKSIHARISDLVNDAVRFAANMDSYGEKIPPRQQRTAADETKAIDQLGDDELGYPPSEYISELTDDILRAKIDDMRKLGAKFKRYLDVNSAVQMFVRQGEYMKDVEDDFGRNCFCGVERPIYGALSTDQLRTYFSWRTLARKGIYNKTDKPYIMLYCNELLNLIGVDSATEAYNKICAVWLGCRGFCPALDKTLPRLLKDFSAYNNIAPDAAEPPVAGAQENIGEDTADILNHRYSAKLNYFAGISPYNIRESIFFTPESEPMIEGALEYALIALDEYFSARGVALSELVCGRLRKDRSWTPFAGMYVDTERMDGFHEFRVGSFEIYSIKRGEPCLEVFEPTPYRMLAGWVLKSIEAVLRKRTGFRYGITPNIKPVIEETANREKLHNAVSAPEFEGIVTRAAEKWCDEHGIFPPKKQKKRKGYNYDEEPQTPAAVRTPVEIDVTKLEQIRRDSDEITRKLIVEEPETLQQEEIADRMAEIEDDSFEELTAEFADDYAVHGSGGAATAAFSELRDGWREFAEGLTANDIELLRAVLSGNGLEYCRSRNIMPETLYDKINSQAVENIGDILIENGRIIEDYEQDIERILKLWLP